MKILTDILLPSTLNGENNNCGAIAVMMILQTDFGAERFSLRRVMRNLNKTSKENTQPGFICKLFKKLGYKVTYYSKIEWKNCIFDPDKFLEKWDKKIQGIARHYNWYNLKKMQESAIWLLDKDQDGILKKNDVTLRDIKKALKEGQRVITVVRNGTHYVVITGIDNHNVYYNDPNFPDIKKMARIDFESFCAIDQNAAEIIFIKKQ
ncbi:MAG: C39 family peptidase [bacterium]